MLWSERASDVTDQNGLGVAVDSGGNVLVTGDFTGAMALGGCPLSKGGANSLFVVKLDPSGTCFWSKNAGDAGTQHGQAVAVDTAGNVVVVGSLSGAMNLAGCPLQKAGSPGLVIAKLDASGACLWSKEAGGAVSGHALAVDAAGNILVTGIYDSAMDWGGCPLSKAGGTGFFVSKLDSSGACLWSRRAKGNGSQDGRGVVADQAGNVLVTGSFDTAPSPSSVSLPSAGATDFFLVKLDAAGEYLWTHRAGGTSDDAGNRLAVDTGGYAPVTGTSHGQSDFGTGLLVSEGGSDIFVAKYAP